MEQKYWSAKVFLHATSHTFPPLTIKVSGGRVGGEAMPLQLLCLLPGTLKASDGHRVEQAIRLLQV